MFKTSLTRVGTLMARAAGFAVRFHNDTRANVLAVVALSLVPLIGALALGSEAASWNVTNRGMQNAADSAAVAAATAGYSGNTAYANEGYAVAARYGFTGADHTSKCTTRSVDCVNVLNNQTCPDATTGCYQVTISRPQALLLTQVLSLVGFNGDTTVGAGGANAVAISASAMAEIKLINGPICILALSTLGNAIDLSGVPNGNLGGCTMVSNGSVKCGNNNGNGAIGAGLVAWLSVPTPNHCDPTPQVLLTSAIVSPYAGAFGAHPAGCTALPGNALSTAAISAGGCFYSTGNVTMSGTVSTNQSKPTVLYVENGAGVASLTGSGCLTTDINVNSSCGDLTGVTPGSGGLTLVFPNGAGNTNAVPSSINLNISSPAPPTGSTATTFTTTGTGATTFPYGYALYDPGAHTSSASTNNVSYSGNSPVWNLSGIAYFPGADVAFSGVPNKAGSGYDCFVLVGYTVQINGTATIMSNPSSQCTQQGSPTPTVLVGFRTPLVS